MKKAIDVEKLVEWTFREELPKKPYPVSDFWARLIELGTRIDDSCTSDQPGFYSDTPPHPDALLTKYAVDRLEDMRVDVEISRDALMGELACWLTDDRLTQAMLCFQTRALVTTHAMMGTRPNWDLGEIRSGRITGRNGKPVVNGITAGSRYADGAHCPLQLNIDPRTIANARGEYAAWRTGLLAVKAHLEVWMPAEFVVTGPAAEAEPWHQGTKPKPKILRDVLAAP